MIISHSKQFIFFKTRKVGGTSFEIALSRYCGRGDIIAPISEEDEAVRQELGYPGAQNYLQPYSIWPSRLLRSLRAPSRKQIKTLKHIYNHKSAAELRKIMPDNQRQSYFKFSIVRNPFDRMVSQYYWVSADKKFGSMDNFVKRSPRYLTNNRNVTHINDKSVMDFFIRYEDFEHDLNELEQHIKIDGLWDTFKNLKAKSVSRPKRGASVEEIFSQSPEARDIIAEVCREDIESFGYKIPG